MPEDDDLVAPIQRINITVEAHTKGQPEGELPLNILVLGDFKGRPDELPLYLPTQAVHSRSEIPGARDVRGTRSITKDTDFERVLREMHVTIDLDIGDTAYEYKIERMIDFGPDAIVSKLAPFAKLVEIRQALESLLTPLKNPHGVRKLLEDAVRDESKREALVTAMGIENAEASEGN
ncbi:MAG: type VI secretion system contractile sheath small subunit [Acidobacteriaceae bacterium]|nr:type VI secretion system contractile sheath small subunit [Acidobacteriaceae bacterium]MBV9296406.1 type VI secretion system contractile sheath small subunit [Acidobacteriaceae bacterium]MBV9764382.1 type VI secretion system contractile sheath small subunit [Acidobacteriaceae bacterium]